MYIQTTTPLAFGTMIHLDVRLATEHAVIRGTGCVVWNRDVAHASRTRPAGMGIRFVDLDRPSKALIDKLVSDRADAGLAYEEPLQMEDATIVEPPRSRAPPAVSAPPVAGVSIRRATLMGIGVSSLPPVPAPAQSHAPVAEPPSQTRPSMFPQSDSHAEMPQGPDLTLIRQVSEVLDAALHEVAAPAEEITDSLFSRSASVATAPAAAPSLTESAGPSDASEDLLQPDLRPPRIAHTPGGSSRRRSWTGALVVTILLASIVLAPATLRNKLRRGGMMTAPRAILHAIESKTTRASAAVIPSAETATASSGHGSEPAAAPVGSSDASQAAAPEGPAGASPTVATAPPASTVPGPAPLLVPIGKPTSPAPTTHTERRTTRKAPTAPARPKRPSRPTSTGADDNPY